MFLPGETRSITLAVLSLTQVKCSSLLTGPQLNYGSYEKTVHLYPFYFFFFFFFFFFLFLFLFFLFLFFCFSMFYLFSGLRDYIVSIYFIFWVSVSCLYTFCRTPWTKTGPSQDMHQQTKRQTQ